MRRTLAAALVAVAAFAAPAVAGPDPLQTVKDAIGECMDCIPSRCQILNNCEIIP